MNQLSSITPLEIILIALAAVGIFFFFRACWRNIKRSRQHLGVALLTLMMTLTAQTATAAVGDVVDSGTCGKNLAWTLTDNGGTVTLSDGDYSTLTLTITGTGAMYDYTSDTRPWGTADKIRYRITTLNLPEGITHIGDHAFYFTNYSGPLVIPSTVKTIGAFGFYAFYGATSVTIPASVTSIGEMGFLGYGGKVSFAEGSLLTSIGANAFENVGGSINMKNCTKLTAITAENVFIYFEKTVTFPRTMTSVCKNAFKYGSKSPAVRMDCDGLLTVNGYETKEFVGKGSYDITSCFRVLNTGSRAVTMKHISFSDMGVLTLDENITASGSTVEYDSKTYYYGTVTLGYSGVVPTGGIVKYAVNGDYISGNEFTISGDADVTAIVVYPYADISGLTYHGSTFDILGNTYVTSGSYYEINDEQDLIDFANYVNAGNTCAGLTFKLTADLDFTNMPKDLENGMGNFLPIGFGQHLFEGHFDGQNHSITGLYFNGVSPRVGLFCIIKNSGIAVENVTLVNPNITAGHSVGGIVGRITNGTISNCAIVGGSITGIDNVGSIVGETKNTTVSGCSVIGTAITAGNPVGIIAGPNDGGLTISNCNYYNITNGLSICGSSNPYTDGGGNQRVYQVTLGEGITATSPAFAYGNKAYYAENATVTLGSARDGYALLGYQSDDVTISNGTFTMPASDVSINANWAEPNDFSVNAAGDEYTIKTAAGWGVFCDMLEGGTSFTGKTVYLDKDISVTRMAGSSSHKFTGSFNGQGNTLTVDYTGTSYVAPFRYVDGATIQNLRVEGTINSSGTRAAGVIGETGSTGSTGTSHITNCMSSSTISGSDYTGGFSIGGNVEIEGCVFNGTINGSSRSGGFVGYSQSTLKITNCLFAPQDGSTISGGTFYYNGGGDITPVNSYYTQALGTAQGKQARSITAGENVTVANAGNATEYTVSDITAYGTGIKYGGVLYAGADEEVSLTLSHTDRDNYAFNGYTASTCTLSGSDNPYTLTMPNADVTITGNYLSTLTSGTCGKTSSDNVTWELTGDADHYTLTISGTGDMADYTLVKQQPWRYYASSITSVVVGNGVMSIGENAFNGCKLSSITLPEGLTTINAAAFADNGTTIATVSIPQSVTSIGDHAFDGTSVTHFYINNIPSKIAISANTPFVASGTTFHVFTQMLDVFANATNWSNYAGHFLDDIDITHVASVALDNERMIVKTLASGRLNATINPADARVKDVMFTSSNDMIFRITDAATGEFQAGSIEGEATITCTAMDGSGEYATCVVRVNKNLIPAESVTLNKSEKSMNVGETFKLTATVNPGNATHKNCTWRSSDENVATVSSNGMVAAVAAGVATITAISGDGNARANCVLTVKAPVTTSYVDADGTLHENVTAMPLDNSMTTLAAGWYVVNEDVTFTSKITLDGDVNFILGDGKTMTVTNTGTDHEDRAIYGNEKTLHIYGQSQGTGALTATAVGGDAAICLVINQKATSMLGIHGGVVSASTECASGNGILVQCETDAGGIVIDGGQVTALGKKYGIYCEGGHFDIIGGQVTATGTNGYGLVICDCSLNPGVLTLGYSKATDFVSTNSIYNYSGESFVGEVKIADDQTLVDGNGNIWSGTLSNDEIQSIRNQTLRPVTGVALTKDGSGNISATFDGTLLETVNIPVGVTVNSVTLNRTFTPGKASTVMLPFDYTCTGNEGGTFYKFVSMEKENDQWVATMKATGDDTNNVGTLTKNTPYLFLPTATGIAFTIPNEGVTLCTEGGGNCQTADAGSHWTFKGTNSYIKWTSNTADADYTQERADEIGKVYGFAGVQKDGIDVGDFVKAKSGAKIRPMTCYLIWNSTPNRTRGMTRGTIDELPSSIVVRLLSSVGPGNQGNDNGNQGNDDNGGTTAVGTLDTETDEIDFGGWYDMSGRKLSVKPTQKGLYIHNGKKVIIK